MAWTPTSDGDLDPQPGAAAKVLRLPARQVIQEDRLVPANQLPARRFGSLQRWWVQTPAIVKKDAAGLTVLIGTSVWLSLFSPFFVFGLGLVVRLFFFLIYALRVEIGKFEAKVAARTLAYINVTAIVAITVVLVTTTAIWKYQAYSYLVFALAFEIWSVSTWYTKWAADSENWNDGNHGLNRVFEPKKMYLLAAFAFLIGEYIAFGIEWCPLLDTVILFTYHAILWLYHFILLVCHIIAVIGHALSKL